jgi:hypothetical protein
MAKLGRQFWYEYTGKFETEDWWSLVFDVDANLLHVEHRWMRRNPSAAGGVEVGSSHIEVNDFLAHDSHGRPGLIDCLKSLLADP